MRGNVVSADQDPLEQFDTFKEEFKYYENGKLIEELNEMLVSFDAKMLELENYYDPELINKEMNTISRKLYRYGMILESQNQILQTREDEYEMWRAKKYMEIEKDTEDIPDRKGNVVTKPVDRTEKQKEYVIMTRFEDEYKAHQSMIRSEQYKSKLIKRVVSSLESYSYKLHALYDYNKLLIQKGSTHNG